ncbi:MAG: TrmJ/YjtD family RNA methyltransferase [Desulfobacterales bacterium]|nr:TrmJ/YjtD family RNA methyltransferase [Desulfobacterales bacterium]MBF0398138.1 TrmJ/YjtD family RNA methyltransferase [Desulfobacterales bacterium]
MSLDHITIVLNKPRYSENIGASARAMLNMGISKLIVVEPLEYDLSKVSKMATHVAADVVKNIAIYDSLRVALSPFGYIIGTTARTGKKRETRKSISKVFEKIINISQNNEIAILFGPENKGLSSADLRLCHEVITIPTCDFSSLNLAQAVMIACYEFFSASMNKDTEEFVPRLATRFELDPMYDELKDIMIKISFIKADNADYWMKGLRDFFTRINITAKEVKMIRGICRQINWYGQKRLEPRG